MVRKNDPRAQRASAPTPPPEPPAPPVIDQGGFNLGDVVVLKSGGVAMTIEEFSEGEPIYSANKRTQVLCTWFRPDGSAESAHFYVTSIMLFVPAANPTPAAAPEPAGEVWD